MPAAPSRTPVRRGERGGCEVGVRGRRAGGGARCGLCGDEDGRAVREERRWRPGRRAGPDGGIVPGACPGAHTAGTEGAAAPLRALERRERVDLGRRPPRHAGDGVGRRRVLYGGDAGTSEAYGSTVPLTSVPLVVEWPYSGSPCVLYRRWRRRRQEAGRPGGGGAPGARVRASGAGGHRRRRRRVRLRLLVVAVLAHA